MTASFSSAPRSFLRTIYRAIIQPSVHMVRRSRYPDIPLEHMLTPVAYEGRSLILQSRRWNNSDASAIDQCFIQKQYDFPVGAHGALVKNLYQDILASGRKPLIVDCGANIGASVAWFSAKYPEAHIVGIEPSTQNFVLLKANCKNLDVDLRQAGIAAKDGQAYIIHEDWAMGCQTVSTENGKPIDMISLETIIGGKPASEYAPFLLKIDIEGAESDLFDGDCSRFNSFPLIVMEPHDWLFPGKLSSRGFFRFHAENGREFSMKTENIASIVNDERLLEITTGLTNGSF